MRYWLARAPITVLVFSDFESFPCARSANLLAGFLRQTRDVRVIFKRAPAATNPSALPAHEAALAAGARGKFGEMHDTLFENQIKLSRADLLCYDAKTIGSTCPSSSGRSTATPIARSSGATGPKPKGSASPPRLRSSSAAARLVGRQGYASLGTGIESLLAGVPQSQRVQEEFVASGPAQAINIGHAPAKGPSQGARQPRRVHRLRVPLLRPSRAHRPRLLAAYPKELPRKAATAQRGLCSRPN